jgi:hypothetical protein
MGWMVVNVMTPVDIGGMWWDSGTKTVEILLELAVLDNGLGMFFGGNVTEFVPPSNFQYHLVRILNIYFQ